ncbi:MAG: hypothetical protein RLZZ08_1596 [Pseudomonadota bacterium]
MLLDRLPQAADALCGGFISWRTAARLATLGVDAPALGAHKVEQVVIFTRTGETVAALPAPAFGLSRRTMDGALRAQALALGAQLEIDSARGLDGTTVLGKRRDWRGDGLFLATGKHDLRGMVRPRRGHDPALGLRLRLPASPALHRLLAGRIELHLFTGGYAGIVIQEDGSANLCLAVRKSRLAAAAGDPHALLADLAQHHPAFASRLEPGWQQVHCDSIGAVPYGWIARSTAPGLFRLGDQAAVIPSLAGEGMAIALASGQMAAAHWLTGGAAAAQQYQRSFARHATVPVRIAGMTKLLAENGLAAGLALRAVAHVPRIMHLLLHATRMEVPASLAQPPARP